MKIIITNRPVLGLLLDAARVDKNHDFFKKIKKI